MKPRNGLIFQNSASTRKSMTAQKHIQDSVQSPATSTLQLAASRTRLGEPRPHGHAWPIPVIDVTLTLLRLRRSASECARNSN
ncbi:unnamed protein product [Lasius platythorax]|uniref:Uncharacterized protein n=1 Tax=Lasius platythorax TaxID=488582 RepID=A0AAV2P6J1_9HYME